jgi:hypothetical protein
MDSNVALSAISMPHSAISVSRGSSTLQRSIKAAQSANAAVESHEYQIDDEYVTQSCPRLNDFPENVFSFKRLRSNCGTEYRGRHQRLQVASERGGTTLSIVIGILGSREKTRPIQPAAE